MKGSRRRAGSADSQVAAPAPAPPVAPDLTPADLRAAAEDIRREFPLVATRSALVLFDVDPNQVQAQWQITDAALASAIGAFPAGASQVRPLLRLRRIADDGSSRELAALAQPATAGGLDGVARLRVAEPGGELEAELGLASGEGGWLLLARSNRVRLPLAPQPPGPAPVAATPAITGLGKAAPGQAAVASPAAEKAVGAGGTATGAAASPGEGQPGEPMPESDSRPPSPTTAEPADDAEVEPALAATGPPLAPEFPLCWSDPAVAGRYLRLIAQSSPTEAGPVAPPLSDLDAPWSEPVAAPPTSSDPGAWAELPPPMLPSSAAGVAAEPRPPYAPGAALSSVDLHARDLSADIEIHAELHLWGRAGPGSLVAVFGRPIRVGPDGRFSVRLALRDPEVLAQALAKGEPPGPGGE